MSNELFTSVSFDYWDTLAKREVLPDEVKWLRSRKWAEELKLPSLLVHNLVTTKDRQIAHELTLSGRDGETSIYELAKRVVAATKAASAKSRKLENRLVQIALNLELELVVPIVNSLDEFISLLDLQIDPSANFSVISDFYFNSPDLSLIVQKATPWLFELNNFTVYSSSDDQLTKRTGRKFESLIDAGVIIPSSHLHVGDNPISDYSVPIALGIESIQATPPDHSQSEEIVLERQEIDEKTIDSAPLMHSRFQSRFDTALEIELATLLVSFCYWLASRLGEDQKPFFMTREGLVFRKAWDICFPNNPCPETLTLNRTVALRIALSKSCEWEKIANLVGQYSDLSDQQFMLSLGLNSGESAAPGTFRFDPVMRASQLVSKVADINALEEDAISFEKTTRNQKTLALVDIGWRGSVADLIRVTYPAKPVNKYLLAGWREFPTCNELGSFAKTSNPPALDDNHLLLAESFISQDNIQSVLERLLTPAIPSPSSYNGASLPQAQIELPDLARLDAIREETYSRIPQISSIIEKLKLSDLELKALGLSSVRAIYKLCNTPKYKELFQLHNETFGVGATAVKQKHTLTKPNKKSTIVNSHTLPSNHILVIGNCESCLSHTIASFRGMRRDLVFSVVSNHYSKELELFALEGRINLRQFPAGNILEADYEQIFKYTPNATFTVIQEGDEAADFDFIALKEILDMDSEKVVYPITEVRAVKRSDRPGQHVNSLISSGISRRIKNTFKLQETVALALSGSSNLSTAVYCEAIRIRRVR